MHTARIMVGRKLYKTQDAIVSTLTSLTAQIVFLRSYSGIYKHVVLVSMVIRGEANGCVTPYASRSQKAYEITV